MKRYTWKTGVVEILIILLAILFMYPLYLIVINSLKEGSSIVSSMMSLPKQVTFENFVNAWNKMNFTTAFVNTIMIAVFTVAVVVIFGSMASYKITRRDCLASKIILGLFIVSMIIPVQVVMIPLVIVSRQLHLINHLYGIVLIYAASGIPMAVFLFGAAIRTVPIELEEAAKIDGAKAFTIFFKIVFPLLKPTTVTIAIMNLLTVFNDFMIPKLVLTKNNLVTIQISMQKFYDSFQTDWGGVMAGLILAMLPMSIILLIFQKRIMESLVSGAVKG